MLRQKIRLHKPDDDIIIRARSPTAAARTHPLRVHFKLNSTRDCWQKYRPNVCFTMKSSSVHSPGKIWLSTKGLIHFSSSLAGERQRSPVESSGVGRALRERQEERSLHTGKLKHTQAFRWTFL